MGWASGSSLISDIIERMDSVEFESESKKEFYKILIEAFAERDCDTMDECVGEDDMFDEAYYEVYPERKDEDYNDEEYEE